MIIDKNEFFKIQSSMTYIPYSQSQGWHDYRVFLKKCEVKYFVNDINPVICAWGLVRKVPFIGKILQIDGESYYKAFSKKQIKEFYEQVIQDSQKQFALITVSNSDLYHVNYEIGIRQAGFIRPMVLTLCPLSIMINLTSSDWHVNSSWKKKIKAAKNNNLKFEYIPAPTREQITVVCKMFSELAQCKNLNFLLEIESIHVLLKNSHFKLFMVSTLDNQPLSARVLYVYGNFSYDIFAANSNISKCVRGSSYFMVQSIWDWLKDNGIKQFDFGRIGPGKRSANNVYIFKAYSHGEEVSYNGEWVYAKNKFIETLFYTLLNYKTERW